MSGPRPTMSRRDAHWRHYTVRRMAFLLLTGLALAAGATDAALAQSVSAARTVAGDPHAAFVTEASQRFGIPEHWIVAVKRAESAGDVRAISSAGALGLMQVMPDTWAALRVRYGLGRDPYDPRDNIFAGAAYLREMFHRYRTIPAMLGAYNAGPGRYDEYVQTGRALPRRNAGLHRAAGSAARRTIAGERAIGCAATAAGLAGSAALRRAFRRRSFGNIDIGKRAVERQPLLRRGAHSRNRRRLERPDRGRSL